MKKLTFPLTILFFLLILSCNSDKRISREVFEQVQKSQEIKIVHEVDILNKALEWGEEISLEAQKELMGTLQKVIGEQGVPGAIEFCNVEALPILKRVSNEYGVSIRRVSNRYRNPADQPTESEKGILEAYEYNEENGVEGNTANIQKLENGEELLFTKAITIPGGLCLNCHGEPGIDIQDETLEIIDRLYPEDKAKEHQIGSLRGMWSISIPIKEVVNKM